MKKLAKINEKNTLTFVSKVGAAMYAFMALIVTAVWFFSGDLTVLTGALFGGGLSLLNFEALKRIGRKVVEDPKKLKVHYFALVWLKFFAVIVLCFMTIVYWDEYFSVPAFFISLGIIIAAIIVATMYAVYQGFSDLIDDEWKKTEEKFIGWEDVDKPHKKDYKAGSKKGVFDRL